MFKKVSIGVAAMAFIFAAVAAVAAPQQASALTNCIANTYSQGSSGRCPADIQHMLNGAKQTWGGNWNYLYVDGVFGTLTHNAVHSYQTWITNHGDYLASDGVVGYNTWRHLCWDASDGKYWPAGSYANTAYIAGADAGCAQWPDIWQ